jgi:hypothetical protein
VAYAAPEQVRSKALNKRADIWAFVRGVSTKQASRAPKPTCTSAIAQGHMLTAWGIQKPFVGDQPADAQELCMT